MAEYLKFLKRHPIHSNFSLHRLFPFSYKNKHVCRASERTPNEKKEAIESNIVIRLHRYRIKIFVKKTSRTAPFQTWNSAND